MWISVGVHLDHVFITAWTSRWRNAPRVWGGCACALGAFVNGEGNSLLRSPTQDHCGTTRLTPFKDKIKELCAFTVPCDFNPFNPSETKTRSGFNFRSNHKNYSYPRILGVVRQDHIMVGGRRRWNERESKAAGVGTGWGWMQGVRFLIGGMHCSITTANNWTHEVKFGLFIGELLCKELPHAQDFFFVTTVRCTTQKQEGLNISSIKKVCTGVNTVASLERVKRRAAQISQTHATVQTFHISETAAIIVSSATEHCRQFKKIERNTFIIHFIYMQKYKACKEACFSLIRHYERKCIHIYITTFIHFSIPGYF